MKKKLSIYGCTGSIGNSTFKLFKNKKKFFKFYILTGYKNYKKIKFLIRIKPTFFVIFDDKTYIKIKKENFNNNVKILNSKEYNNYKFKKSDISILAIPGIAGLAPTLKAIELSKKVLIANKESVICGWDLITKLIKKNKVKILPLDSEHFSIMNLINETNKKNIEKIYLNSFWWPIFKLYPKKNEEN